MVSYLWAVSFAAQALVLVVLIYRRHYRHLPFFTSYIVLNLGQAMLLYFTYGHYGNNSDIAQAVGWWSEAITLGARLCATAEILHWVMMGYSGIWSLAWRLMLVSSLLVLMVVALASRGDAGWALLHADRGFHVLFAAVLIPLLALIRYYFVPVDPMFKSLLISFCFYSCVKVLLNTALRTLLYPQLIKFGEFWQLLVMAPYLIVVLWWASALVRPFPASQGNRAVLPANAYQRISPEIQAQLQAINLQLMIFWDKREAKN